MATPPTSSPGPATDPETVLDRPRLDRLRAGAVVVPDTPAVFELNGPGALDCLQGMLTNDLVKPGEQSVVYGAMLTPKGMVVVDAWVLRLAQGITLLTARRGHGAALELFRRQLPPRLAQVVDRTGRVASLRLYGEQSIGALRFAGLGGVPEAGGRAIQGSVGGESLIVARPNAAAPFTAFLVGVPPALDAALGALLRSGVVLGDEAEAEAARILAGWPALGAEIDERTLPQEARYDAIEGVSYTKGCYVGQETVARLHFRGHTNREVQGLLWRSAEPLEGRAIVANGGKEVGSVRSVLRLEDRRIGLGTMRREISPGASVLAGGRSAEVIALPFAEQHLPG